VPSARRRYVERVLELYRHTPDTLAYIRRADRRLAANLHDRGVPLRTVEDALILVTARRAFRSNDAPQLAPIASLHYFLPVIHELQTAPPDPGYLDYIRDRLARRIPAPDDAHQLP
jgi:hypothetical protein